jgi:hypothetical protein
MEIVNKNGEKCKFLCYRKRWVLQLGDYVSFINLKNVMCWPYKSGQGCIAIVVYRTESTLHPSCKNLISNECKPIRIESKPDMGLNIPYTCYRRVEPLFNLSQTKCADCHSALAYYSFRYFLNQMNEINIFCVHTLPQTMH